MAENPPLVPPDTSTTSTSNTFYLDLAGTLLVPYTIFYLVHVPNTRLFRISLLPLGYIAAVRLLFLGGFPSTVSPTLGNELFNLIPGSATRWALSQTPPIYEARAERSPFSRLRQTKGFRAIDLLINYHRHVGIVNHTPLRSLGKSRVGYIIYHAVQVAVLRQIWTELVYPVYLFAGSTTLSRAPPADLKARMADLSLHIGIPTPVITSSIAVLFALTIQVGLGVIWHFIALVQISTGLWNGEEFPELLGEAWKSTSMTEFWGKRYHRLNRDFLLLWTEPFESLGKGVRLFVVFLISGWQHYIIYSSQNSVPSSFTTWFGFFTAAGLGIVLERAWFKFTGRRVGGPLGVSWMLSYVAIMFGPAVEWFWRLVVTDQMASLNPNHSLLGWGLCYAGVGPRPGSLLVYVEQRIDQAK